MASQQLEDASHRVIGYIETMGDGEQRLEDSSHRVLGYYNPRTNQTEDANHFIVGYGNLLMTLLR